MILPLLLILLPLLPPQGEAPEELPQGAGVQRVRQRVTDLTGTLSSSEGRALEERLRAIETATSNQIIVVMISTTGMEPIEDAALRIAEQNGVGKKEKNNGVLLLVALQDRRIRIEVGYGLEGALPDALAGTIIRNEITPAFRDGEYFRGIMAGVEAIDRATRNEYTADSAEEEGGGILPFLILLLIIFFITGGFGRRRRGIFPMGAGFPGFPTGGRSSGGIFGGGFPGGGGFRGGGGSFGGGGASGRW